MSTTVKRALVFGGTGHVGSAVLRRLATAGVPTTFTYRKNADKARALASEYSMNALELDIRDASAVRAALSGIEPPNVFVHCAGVSDDSCLADIGDEAFDELYLVNARSAFVACQALAPAMAAAGGGSMVLVGALDRTQSVPVPVHFAASQGMLSAMTMALAKELGGDGILVNMLAIGLLDGGIGAAVMPMLVEEYVKFSALRRLGTADEVARVIGWLALENSYVNGRVIAVNGGI